MLVLVVVVVAVLTQILCICSPRATTRRNFLMSVDGADLDVGRSYVPLASHHILHVQIPFFRQRQNSL